MAVRVIYKYPIVLRQEAQRIVVGANPKIRHFDLNPDSGSEEPALWIEHDKDGDPQAMTVFIVGTGWPIIGDATSYTYLGTVIRPNFGGVWHLYRMEDPA